MGAMLISSCRSQIPLDQASGADRGKILLSLKADAKSSTLRILDLNDYSFKDWVIPLRHPHSMALNQQNPDEMFLYEFMGNAAKVNLITDETQLIPGSETNFAGHAVQFGDVIWTTEKYFNGEWVSFARKASDLSVIPGKEHTFKSGHHIVKMPGSSQIVTGSEGRIIFYDLEKKKLVREIAIDKETSPIHFFPLSESEVISVTGIMDGSLGTNFNLTGMAPAYYANTRGDVRPFWDEKEKEHFRFGFGIKKLSTSSWLTGHNLGNAVFLWKDYKIVKKFEMKSPQTISLTKDGTQFIVHTADKLHFYSFKTYELEKTIDYGQPIIAMSDHA